MPSHDPAFAPQFLVTAPGRVNFLGEHIDYNDGIVLPFAIDRHVSLAARVLQTSPSTISVFSDNYKSFSTFLVEETDPPKPAWLRYPWAVVREFARQGFQVPSFQARVSGNLPCGAGLSSSAAFEVATAILVNHLTKANLTHLQIARLCQAAEYAAAGVPCGIMDQLASLAGRKDHLIALDCQNLTLDHVAWNEPELALLVIDTGVKHALGSSPYAARRATCESIRKKLGIDSFRAVNRKDIARLSKPLTSQESACARHVVEEIHRVQRAMDAIRDRDRVTLGNLMFASHGSLRDDFQASWPEADFLVELAQRRNTNGHVLGCRMTGGGFGGSVVCLVQRQGLDNWVNRVTSASTEQFGRSFVIREVQPSHGANLTASMPPTGRAIQSN